MWPTWLPVMGLLALSPGPIPVHDIYSHLIDNLGGSCCSDHDCQPVPYRISAGGVQMLINGSWTDIPSEKIQYRSLPGDKGQSGGAHWCGSHVIELGDEEHAFYLTRCAILPPQSASAEGAVPSREAP